MADDLIRLWAYHAQENEWWQMVSGKCIEDCMSIYLAIPVQVRCGFTKVVISQSRKEVACLIDANM